MKALITTTPFEIEKSIYVKKLKNLGVDIICNQKNSKFSKNELISFGKDCDFLIAGTDQLDQFVLKKLKNLKLISRVGVGYDNIDMDFCNNHDKFNWKKQTDNLDGIYGAMNEGFIEAKENEWLIFWGSDDWAFSYKCLENLFNKINILSKKSTPDLIFCKGQAGEYKIYSPLIFL